MYKPNWSEINELVEGGYLRKVISPCGKLFILNYTDKTTYERKWNIHTLNNRGTVYETATNKLVSRPFKKFFNLCELNTRKQKRLLERKSYTVHEKCDGSMIHIFRYEGKWWCCTRGSFTSDQAIKASELLNNYRMDLVAPVYTLVCEVIYPSNKIIVNYGDQEKLVLLAAFNKHTCREESLTYTEVISIGSGIELAKRYKYSIEQCIELQKTLPKDEEGFVIRFDNGERVKVKGEEYLKIARVLSHCSPLSLWKTMEKGKVSGKVKAEIPEEIYPEIEPIITRLENKFKCIINDIACSFIRNMPESMLGDNLDYKKIGVFLKDKNFPHQSCFFNLMRGNNKAIEKYIMKLIKPVANVLD